MKVLTVAGARPQFIKASAVSRLIITDSGGVQKEAYLLGVPCITLREETEWVETVEVGWNCVVGIYPIRISESVKTFCPKSYRPSLFGDGRACERIVKILAAAKY